MTPNLKFFSSAMAMLLALSSPFSKAEEKKDPTGIFENDPPNQRPSEQDHLLPPTPDFEDYSVSYQKLLNSNLKLDSFYLALMLVMPAFEGEYSVLLRGDQNSYSIEGSKNFSLIVTKAEKSIWYSMPKNNQEKKQKEIKLKTTTASIPAPLAARLHELWNRMILRARYSTKPNQGPDGISIRFATAIGQGEVWSPSEPNSPFLLAQLGGSLDEYCQAPEEERDEFLKKINVAADTLEAYLKDHPQDGDPGSPSKERKK